jgi:hypothetical protein
MYVVHVITTLASSVVDTGTEVANERVVTIDEYWLNLLISMLLPIVVAVVTKRFAAGSVKAVTLIALSVITGWLTSLQATGGAFEIKSAVTAVLVSFVAATASHFGLLAPANITGADGVVQRTVQGGIGRDIAHP